MKQRNVRQDIRRMLLSVELLVALLIQYPLALLLRRAGLAEYGRLIATLCVIAVFFIGGLVRRAFGRKR